MSAVMIQFAILFIALVIGTIQSYLKKAFSHLGKVYSFVLECCILPIEAIVVEDSSRDSDVLAGDVVAAFRTLVTLQKIQMSLVKYR